MQWDPKRQCQKGDRIAYDNVVYDAVYNSSEGPFFDLFLCAVRNLFCGELGHPSSSYRSGAAFEKVILEALILTLRAYISASFWS